MVKEDSNKKAARASTPQKSKDTAVRLSIQVSARHKQDIKQIAAREKITQRKLLEYLIESAPATLSRRYETTPAANESANTVDAPATPAAPLPEDGAVARGLVQAANGCERGSRLLRALVERVREWQ
jgi:hypothetical protein